MCGGFTAGVSKQMGLTCCGMLRKTAKPEPSLCCTQRRHHPAVAWMHEDTVYIDSTGTSACISNTGSLAANAATEQDTHIEKYVSQNLGASLQHQNRGKDCPQGHQSCCCHSCSVLGALVAEMAQGPQSALNKTHPRLITQHLSCRDQCAAAACAVRGGVHACAV